MSSPFQHQNKSSTLKKDLQTNQVVAQSVAQPKKHKPETKAAVVMVLAHNAKCSQQLAPLVARKQLFLSNLLAKSLFIAVIVTNHNHAETTGKINLNKTFPGLRERFYFYVHF